MANCLVPYTQHEQKWTSHYMAQVMKQIKTKGNDQTIERKDGAAIYHLTHNAIGSPS